MRGFLHLDIYRAQRAMNFRPVAITEVSAYLLSTALGVWLALELRDYRAMLYALLAQQALLTLVSHLAAKRGYRLGWDRALVGRAFAFGWPLLLNGALMFGIFQGDRMIVASEIGLVELGWFSAAFTLALTPSLLAARTLQSFALPQLSKAQEDPAAFAPRAAARARVATSAGQVAGSTPWSFKKCSAMSRSKSSPPRRESPPVVRT